MENLTNDTPPKKGFWTPLIRYVFHPPQVSLLCFSCTRIHDRADQKLFWRGPKIFGKARCLVRFPPPIRFAPPHITAQHPLECDRVRRSRIQGNLNGSRQMAAGEIQWCENGWPKTVRLGVPCMEPFFVKKLPRFRGFFPCNFGVPRDISPNLA